MQVWINDKPQEIDNSANLAAIIADLSLPQHAVAVAVNDAIIPRDSWSDVSLKENDRVAVFQAIAGG